MPAGLGWHPYFNREQAILKLPTTRIWWVDDSNGWSTAEATANILTSLSTGARVETLSLDHAFSLSDPELSIIWPDLRLDIQCDPIFQHAVIYVPDGEDFFCVEPVSQIPNAVNLSQPFAETGLVDLAPGSTLAGRIRLTATRLKTA